MSIPKIIHYCWFGGKEKPELAVKCLKSWRKHCPDYEIKEWNEHTFNLADVPPYVKEALEEKRWAFVSDYVRLRVLVEEGGVYMDTDVEVLRSLDPFLHHTAFAGFEAETRVQTGLLACEPGFPLFREFLSYYDTASFRLPDGSLNTTTNVTVLTNLCRERGLRFDDTLQTVAGLTVYPRTYFCPVDYSTMKLKKTRKTRVVHWFSGSWHTEQELQALEAERLRQKKERQSELRYLLGRKLFGEKGYDKLKSILKRH